MSRRPATLSPETPDVPPPERGDDGAERALVAAAQQGDDAAFGALYRSHAPRIFALLIRLAGDEALASDLLQETFLQAWRGLPHWRAESALGTWLHRIAVNAHLGALRARRRREAHETVEAEMEKLAGIAAPLRDPAGAIDIERAITALPPRMRTAFVLRDVEGYSYDEIALVTDTAPGTIRAQVSRARFLLGRELER
ncbi:MAG: sigma-70 family RNA polymerase sigma factor [Gemmatimonadaceae bacterium]|nr:sigma-70 family RNA polymerase sigma factor [Gemmatimonadaceae bacterium]